jgi:hypothetical protein
MMTYSIIDYPLRTTALMVMVAISCALMLRVYVDKFATSVTQNFDRYACELAAGQRS